MSDKPAAPTLHEKALASLDLVDKAHAEVEKFVTALGTGFPELDEMRHQVIRLRARWGKPAPAKRTWSGTIRPNYTGD